MPRRWTLPPRTPMPTPHVVDEAALLAHAEGIRRLARSLVGDDGRADDVAQETLRIAIERGGRANNLAGWLVGVARNVARVMARSDRRREAREHGAARPEAAPESADVLERMEQRRQVIDAVLALPEDSRVVVSLRYFEDLPPRAIAKRLGVPV